MNDIGTKEERKIGYEVNGSTVMGEGGGGTQNGSVGSILYIPNHGGF
jgi:hypothetical protein